MPEAQSKAVPPNFEELLDLYNQINEFLDDTRWGTHILVEDLLGALSTQSVVFDCHEPGEVKEEVRIARTLASLVAEKAGELSSKASKMSKKLDTMFNKISAL
jgi:hypothetical protein